MGQPKDYETFEEFLNSGYKELNIWGKFIYQLQEHIFKVISISVAGGYIAGTYFGMFW
jgi:hypothetical protein